MAAKSIEQAILNGLATKDIGVKDIYSIKNEVRDYIAHRIMAHVNHLEKEYKLDRVNLEFVMLSFFDSIFKENE